jgi:Uma2 family endonuclease
MGDLPDELEYSPTPGSCHLGPSCAGTQFLLSCACHLTMASSSEKVTEVKLMGGGRVMSERPSVWGQLPGDGDILTTSEYLQTAETLRVQELINGMVRLAESPSPRHQDLLLEIAVLLRVFVGQHRVGSVWIAPLDVILDPRRALIVQPDLFYISNKRRDIITDRIWGAPDMVLEVMSPNPRIGDLQERVGWFCEYGVRECWLVHQLTREIEVLELTHGGVRSRQTYRERERIESTVLPFFGLSPDVLTGW